MKKSFVYGVGAFLSLTLILSSCTGRVAIDQDHRNNLQQDDLKLTGGVENPPAASSWSGNRSPASTPWAPGVVSPSVDHSASAPQNDAPKMEVPNKEATIGCSIRLDQLPISRGSPYSVLHVLNARVNYQAAMMHRLELGSFSGNFSLDRQTLAPWFGGVLMGPGSDLFAASKSSKAYHRALSFMNGAMPARQMQGNDPWGRQPVQHYQWQDYVINAQVAGVMAAMFATISDAECTRYIRGLANKILPPEVAAELDEIPFVQAAEDLKAGKLHQEFGALDRNRANSAREIERIEREIEQKQRESKVEVSKIQIDLKKSYQALRLKFVQMPGCRRLVAFHESTRASFVSEKEFLDGIQSDCRAEINKSLDRRLQEQVEETAKHSKLQEQREKSAGKGSLPTSQEKAANERLQVIQDKVNELYVALEWVNGATEDSLVKEMNVIENLLNRRTQLSSTDYYAAERARIAEIQNRRRADSAKWMTYGYAGGFDFLPAWTSQYKNLGNR